MKINCPTCLEPIEFGAELANSAQKCPVCNNRVDVPAAKEPQFKPVAAKAPRESGTPPARAAGEVEPTKEVAKAAPKFSFRITGSVILLLLFLLTTVAVFGLAVTFYLEKFDAGPMLDIRDMFFKGIGIAGPAEYSARVAAITMGTAVVLGFLGLIALVAISKRKRILAITILALLVVSGFAIGTPFVAILCLILVSVPGRSDVWVQGKRG